MFDEIRSPSAKPPTEAKERYGQSSSSGRKAFGPCGQRVEVGRASPRRDHGARRGAPGPGGRQRRLPHHPQGGRVKVDGLGSGNAERTAPGIYQLILPAHSPYLRLHRF